MTYSISLYNSLSRSKELLPMKDAIGMYVCGPTVYNRPHIGNARSVVIYDVLFRVLQNAYSSVTYVRNITDVDDKINQAATDANITIQALTERITQEFHDDIGALSCLAPTIEPKATEHIAQIIIMIEALIARGYAYEAEGHVLFDTTKEGNERWHYGMLSGRKTEEQEAGARIKVESYKRHAGDFVLWKPAAPLDDISSRFDSPWGIGRPGWHIECSAMSTHYLGTSFDIHGGGADLKFPHHENEIAQSCCAHPDSDYARFWVHNGFLTVNGEKMSKSLGNFITVRELLDQGVRGEVIRFALLSTHYGKPLDWTAKLLDDCKKQLDKLYRKIESTAQQEVPDVALIEALSDDLNTPAAFAALHQADSSVLKASGALLGLLQDETWFVGASGKTAIDVEMYITARAEAKAAKNWAEADRIRDELKGQGIELLDKPNGTTEWKTR